MTAIVVTHPLGARAKTQYPRFESLLVDPILEMVPVVSKRSGTALELDENIPIAKMTSRKFNPIDRVSISM